MFAPLEFEGGPRYRDVRQEEEVADGQREAAMHIKRDHATRWASPFCLCENSWKACLVRFVIVFLLGFATGVAWHAANYCQYGSPDNDDDDVDMNAVPWAPTRVPTVPPHHTTSTTTTPPATSTTSCPPVPVCPSPTLSPTTKASPQWPSSTPPPTLPWNDDAFHASTDDELDPSPNNDDDDDASMKVTIPAPVDARYFGRSLACDEFHDGALVAIALWNITTQHNQVNVYKGRPDPTSGKTIFDWEASLMVTHSPTTVRNTTTATVPDMAMSMSRGYVAFSEGNLIFVYERGDAFNNFQWKLKGGKPIDLGTLDDDDGSTIARVSIALMCTPASKKVLVHAASATGQSGFVHVYVWNEQTSVFVQGALLAENTVTDYRGELTVPKIVMFDFVVTSIRDDGANEDNHRNGKVQMFSTLPVQKDTGPALDTQVVDRASLAVSSSLPWGHTVAMAMEHKLVAIASGTGVVNVYILRDNGWDTVGQPITNQKSTDCAKTFGHSLTFGTDGTDLWVGAPSEPNSPCQENGEIHRYKYDVEEGVWNEVPVPVKGKDKSFGAALYFEWDLVIVGAPLCENDKSDTPCEVLLFSSYDE